MKLFENPLLLHQLGHHIWLRCTWNVAAVENPWGSAVVQCGKVMECQSRDVFIIRATEG